MQANDLLLPPRAKIEFSDIDSKVLGRRHLNIYRAKEHSRTEIFAAAIAFLNEIGDNSHSESIRLQLNRSIDDLNYYSFNSSSLSEAQNLDQAAIKSHGTQAALRRVTRETAPICHAIDRAARAALSALKSSNKSTVVPVDASHMDRLSAKFFLRASLITTPSQDVTWCWSGLELPNVQGDIDQQWPYDIAALSARTSFLKTIGKALGNSGTEHDATSLRSGNRSGLPEKLHAVGVGEACHWLNVQSYECALDWGSNYRELEDYQATDALRVFAMAATNTGQHDAAIRAFADARRYSSNGIVRAHLCYMEALLNAKRKNNLLLSDQLYTQGLDELENAGPSSIGDKDLERAWIYNGRALNEVLKMKREHAEPRSIFQKTFDLLQSALRLVEKGSSPDRVYLRFNLLKNLSDFLEIQGRYAEARYIMSSVFDIDLDSLPGTNNMWVAGVVTRKAALMYRTGDYSGALTLYGDLISKLEQKDEPLSVEISRRSFGVCALALNDYSVAEHCFRRGMEESIDNRCATGLQSHAVGLIASLLAQGKESAAHDVRAEIAERENYDVLASHADGFAEIKALSLPKRLFGLPTSIYEVDLEHINSGGVTRELLGGSPMRAPAESLVIRA